MFNKPHKDTLDRSLVESEVVNLDQFPKPEMNGVITSNLATWHEDDGYL